MSLSLNVTGNYYCEVKTGFSFKWNDLYVNVYEEEQAAWKSSDISTSIDNTREISFPLSNPSTREASRSQWEHKNS